MRKTAIYSCLVFFIMSLILSSCSNNSLNSNSLSNNNMNAESLNNQTTVQTAKDIEKFSGDAEVVETFKQEPLQIDTAIEGVVQFEKDESTSISLEYDPDSDKAQQLSLTASDGTEWNLVIPAHALLKSTTIKMTSLKNIESASLGSLKSGVLLEPDGLEFLKPAALTMSGSGMGDNPILLGGTHDGSKIELAMVEKSGQGISASLLHFSTAYGDPLSDDEKAKQLQNQASEEYKEIRKIALDYLKEPITVPKPPEISLRCPADHTPQDEEAIRKFVLLLNHPEGEIIQELLAAARTDTLLNGTDDEDAFSIALSLAERVMKKVVKLFQTYYPKEEYAKAITQAALITQRDYELLGGNEMDFTKKVAEWVNVIAEKFLTELKEKHDYKLIKVLFTLTREATLLGSARPDLLDDLLAALTFEVQYENTVILGGEVTYKTSGKATYAASNEGLSNYIAQGTGQHTSFESPQPLLTLKMPNEYGFETTIENFDPCFNDTFDIYIDKFANDMESYIAAGYGRTINGAVQANSRMVFIDLMTHGLKGSAGNEFYKFTVPLQNLNVNAAEAHFNRQMEEVAVKFTIRLVHTPQ